MAVELRATINRWKRSRWLTPAALAVALALPPLLPNQYWTHLYFMVVLWAMLSSSLNIAVGYTDLANLSHATFFGIGAYAAALLALRLHVPFYLTLFAGGVVATVSGFLLGLPSLRLRGMYLALATIGFGEIVRLVEINWISLTSGPMGLPGIPGAEMGMFELSKVGFGYYALAILVSELLVIRNIVNSRIGRALRAIKNDDIAAASLGINVVYYKVFAFMLSSFFAGVAGSVYAHYMTFVSPSFTMADSVTMLSMVILGGAGTLFGPVAGAIVLGLLPEMLRFADLYRMVLVGSIMIVAIIAKEGDMRERFRRMVRRLKTGPEFETGEEP
ncbi:MAG: branched-chain amino acid ABC transporter permease [Firmicutes bacterium]|nr:branched-chain amino acid ABC transporter permease [Bacillota bacterium]